MGRVGMALIWHELIERARDRWVLVISILFAVLASGVTLYARSSEASAALTGPSLVTLASLLVPLVALILGHDAIVGESEKNTLGMLLSLPVKRAEVVVAKFLGRCVALALAVGVGFGAAAWFAGTEEGGVLASLLWPTMLLGASFLSIGVLVSSVVKRQVTATSLVIAIWFLFVFFYDLGLLGLLVATDGQVDQQTIAWLTFVNPAGLFRVDMMEQFAGREVLEGLGLAIAWPSRSVVAMLWAAWVAIPLLLSGLLLTFRRVA